MSSFNQITIIGVGLLGGSLARACKHKQLAGRIVGYGRNADNLKQAQDAGVIDVGIADLKEAVQDADLVVLCPPVGALVDLVKKITPYLKPGCLITDVGSVKGTVAEAIDALVPDGVHFVGAHPIAGGEKTGWQDSRMELLQGARCILTPTDRTDSKALSVIDEFWKQVGMKVTVMSAEEHDTIYAAVSHLPHVIAFALMNTVAEAKTDNHDSLLPLAAGGLRDITRVASADAVLWRDVCVHNKKQLLRQIENFEKRLGQIKTLIDNGAGDALKETFERARENRSKLVGTNE